MIKKTIKKVVVLGPESTGKSTLCQKLAEHYKCDWVPEYAREYLEKNGTDYSYDDLLVIAKGQLQLEEQITQSTDKDLLIVDTDMHVMKVWCEFVFNDCHEWIKNQLTIQSTDLYLLCKNDLPWVKDHLREYPDEETREILFQKYKFLMEQQNKPWVLIDGTYESRLKKAIHSIDGLIQTQSN